MIENNKKRTSSRSAEKINTNHYILMADMIDSSEYPIQVLKVFRRQVDLINAKFRLISPLTITLGDEFQGIAQSLEQAINIIFNLERILLSDSYPFKLRYAIGYGPVRTAINSKIAHGMYGEGLTDTRKILEASKNDKRNRFRLLLPDDPFEQIMNNLFLVYNSFLDSWSKNDIVVVKHFFIHEDYKDVAKVLGKKNDQIWKREKNLKIREFFKLQSSILSLASISESQMT